MARPAAVRRARPGGAAGLGRSGLGASGGQRLPVSPRERRPALAALAVLLILGGALTSAYLVMASGERVSAIRIAQPVAAGQQIPMSALEEVQVGDTGIRVHQLVGAREGHPPRRRGPAGARARC